MIKNEIQITLQNLPEVYENFEIFLKMKCRVFHVRSLIYLFIRKFIYRKLDAQNYSKWS